MLFISGLTMSQPRKSHTRSRRASSEIDAEYCSEASLPETVIDAVRKSGRKRVQQDWSSLVKGRKDKVIVVEKKYENNEGSDSIVQGKYEKRDDESGSSSASEPDGHLLDDLIDDFGDEELEDSDSAEEVTQPGMNIVNNNKE